MDKNSAENLVSSAFNFPFNQSKYSELISNIFKNTISINEIAIDEPDFKDFLQKINQYCEFTDEDGKNIHAIEVIVNEKVKHILENSAIFYASQLYPVSK